MLPIGIKISDGSPETIALSILSEIQLVRNDGAPCAYEGCFEK